MFGTNGKFDFFSQRHMTLHSFETLVCWLFQVIIVSVHFCCCCFCCCCFVVFVCVEVVAVVVVAVAFAFDIAFAFALAGDVTVNFVAAVVVVVVVVVVVAVVVVLTCALHKVIDYISDHSAHRDFSNSATNIKHTLVLLHAPCTSLPIALSMPYDYLSVYLNFIFQILEHPHIKVLLLML